MIDLFIFLLYMNYYIKMLLVLYKFIVCVIIRDALFV